LNKEKEKSNRQQQDMRFAAGELGNRDSVRLVLFLHHVSESGLLKLLVGLETIPWVSPFFLFCRKQEFQDL